MVFLFIDERYKPDRPAFGPVLALVEYFFFSVEV